jgi:hypothetical protein
MKISGKIILLALSLLLGSNLVFSQVKLKDIGDREIIGLNLDEDLRKELQNYRTEAFKINDKGVLVPGKGYNVYYFPKRNFIAVTKRTKNELIQAYREHTVNMAGAENVTVRCYTYSSEEDCPSCSVDYQNGEYYCKGCTTCYMDTFLNTGKVPTAHVKQ